MHPGYRELLERRFRVPLPEGGPDRRLSLKDAVAKFTRPGMSLHMACTHSRPYGLGHELMRQYWGRKDAGLEISVISMGETWIGLFIGEMIRKAVTTFAGDVWPYPSPNPVLNGYWKSGAVAFEHWSILSYTQRLLAGALRLPFLPTRSLVGSTMAEDNERNGTYREIEDPFSSGEKTALVAAYRPDLCFIHVAACDASGNAILTPPWGEGPLGVFAAKEGAIVSTEKIVSTEYLREHNHLVKIPAHLVKAVVELPLGGHPRGMTNVGVEQLGQYADDYAFMFEVRKAARKGEDALRAWFKEWVLECQDQAAFLEKLGSQRIRRLKGKAHADAWYEEVLAASRGEEGENDEKGEMGTDLSQYIGSEMMIVAAARKMAVMAKDLKIANILAGVGAANLSAWLCLQKLRDEAYPVETMAEIGYFGYEPRPGDPYIFNFKNTPTCISTTDILTVLGMLVSGGSNLGSLGAAQVDRFGNVNSTCIPGKIHFLGSGGGNDVASGSKAVIVTAYLGKEKFKEKVDYVTSPGTNVRLVVTDRGIFEKAPGQEELVLTAYYASGPTGCKSAEEAVSEIKELVGWDLKVAPRLEAIAAPTQEELFILRLYDPHRQFLR